jgi:hypothetical protein
MKVLPEQHPDVTALEKSIKTNDKKLDEEFRVYEEHTSEKRVVDHYRDMRKNHTVAFYRTMELKYSFEDGKYRRLMTVEEAFDELEHYVVCVDYWAVGDSLID